MRGCRHTSAILTIDYSALSLIIPRRVHFRFKLEGQDKDWREVVNRSPGGVLESAAGELPLPRYGVQQQRSVERGWYIPGLQHCARLLPDELVPRIVYAHVPSHSLDRLSASGPSFRAAPPIVRTESGVVRAAPE